MEKHSKEELLKTADRSPEAVARHDKQVWLSLFAKGAIVEDPVGTAPHRRNDNDGDDDQLNRFYETFIAPNEITFHVYQDIVTSDAVVRDVNIEIESSTGLTINVPTYAIYEIVEENGNLKIARLAAHWELRSMVKQVISQRWPGLKMMTVLGLRMMRMQGVGGIRGYMKGFSGIGQRGKDTVLRFMDALNSRDAKQLTDIFAADNSGIEFPVGEKGISPDLFVESVDVDIAVSDLISAGMVTGFRFEVKGKTSAENGIGLFKFDVKTKKINSAQFFR